MLEWLKLRSALTCVSWRVAQAWQVDVHPGYPFLQERLEGIGTAGPGVLRRIPPSRGIAAQHGPQPIDPAVEVAMYRGHVQRSTAQLLPPVLQRLVERGIRPELYP